VNIAYAGNFDPPHSTENEVRKALDILGHDVWLCQEGQPNRWRELTDRVHEFDVILWTRTADLAKRIPHGEQRRMLLQARRAGVPTVAFHLDRWWGLRENGREDSVWSEPFFRCEHFFSTDGAHDTEWAVAGVNHHWMPPGVSEFECVPGTPRDEWRSDIGFLGSWRHYHGEHTHRRELVEWLRATYGDRVRFFPEPGQPGIRGDDLRDLIASVKVWVGDSCLAPRADGGPMHSYVSDRVPEVTGRGGFLLHPHVDGVFPECWSSEGVLTWRMGDWETLKVFIDTYVADDEDRTQRAAWARRETLERHTYTVRLAQVLEAVCPQLKGTR
jgi:hypothetical protein